jgi:hypothetical protein
MTPLKKPNAMNAPSFVQEQQVILELTLVLGTDLSLNDQSPIQKIKNNSNYFSLKKKFH